MQKVDTEEGEMRTTISGALVIAMLFGGLAVAHARCGDQPGDAQAVADARAQVASDCDCNAGTHGAYVKCAAGVANDRASHNLLRESCKGAVKKCAARSMCGKPGFVTCCRTNASGVTKCSIKSGAAKCTPPKDGSACVGTFSSCCDACTDTGCAASPSGAFLGELSF